MEEARKVNEFDYIKGRLVYKNNKNIKKETDFDFYITKKENRPRLIELLKLFELGDNIIIDTSMPLGEALIGKLVNTTFIVDNSKFYIDEIKSLQEIISEKEEEKNK